nr:MAG TPA: hypothetical protein [Caudoviricetes sp.]
MILYLGCLKRAKIAWNNLKKLFKKVVDKMK